MNIYAILMEPASYTIDRNKNIYDVLNIKYCYMKGGSEASDKKADAECIEGISIFKKITFLRNVLKKNDCIIMNGYLSNVFIILFLLNIIYKKPIGIDSDTQFSMPHNICKRIIKKIYLGIIFKCKYIYGLAGGTMSHFDLFRKYGMPEKRIFLMPMMTDNSIFIDNNYKNKSISPFIFLYVGRLIECKNIPLMINAFIKYSSLYNNSKLVIVGDGDLHNYLKNKYSNEHNIIFKGKVFGDALIKEYKLGNILILPSKYEPWGLVVNEAMSAGLPVIVSDKVGARYDLVDNKNTGFVFKSESEDDLVKCMSKCCEDIRLYREMSDNAYNLMKNYWNYDLYKNCLLKFISVVQDAIK